VQGRGQSVVGGQRLEWEPKDVFCVPAWAFHEHANASATDPAVLFSFTDAPVLHTLALFREEPHSSGHQAGG
jgi:gentisate 1,2-dioxygenase